EDRDPGSHARRGAGSPDRGGERRLISPRRPGGSVSVSIRLASTPPQTSHSDPKRSTIRPRTRKAVFGVVDSVTSDDEALIVIDITDSQEKTDRGYSAVTNLGGEGALNKSAVIGLAYERDSRP